jgi:DNA (cytosine-5)-methyltransferase 1
MHYLWNLTDLNSTPKNNKRVFSTFACGGGSTMGYKLAGYEVIGANDIDPKMAEVYKLNHNPKLFYQCPIKELLTKELPPEMYDLDILDGSPPCSTFSMAGQREENWGKPKKFREGQQEQILDELFFDFVSLVGRLKPKVYVAENVAGMLVGNARKYCNEINRQFQNIGYTCQMFTLNAATMRVPQSRAESVLRRTPR